MSGYTLRRAGAGLAAALRQACIASGCAADWKTDAAAALETWRDARFFSSDDGNLYRIGDDDSMGAPIRANFRRHVSRIETGADVRANLRAGAFAWPGGYGLAFATADGDALCFDCARAEFRSVAQAMRDNVRGDAWRLVGLICEAETDEGCTCSHCGREVWTGADDEDEGNA